MQFALLFLGWGAVWFAAALFWSTLLAGEYVALLAALLTPFAFTAFYVSLPQRVSAAFPAGDSFEFMSGGPFVDPQNIRLRRVRAVPDTGRPGGDGRLHRGGGGDHDQQAELLMAVP